MGLDEAVHIVSATSNHSDVQVQLNEIEKGRRYTLEVFPTNTDRDLRARIDLKTDFPAERPKTFYVYAQVK